MKSSTRPIPAPRLPEHTTSDSLPTDELEDLESYSQLNLADERLTHARGVTFKHMRLTRCDLSGQQLIKADLNDLLADGCDFSNADLMQSSTRRVLVTDCRITGLKLGKSRFQETVFRNCQGKYAQFEGALFKQARFEQCTLIEANFDGADLTGVVFADCDLYGATFTGARLTGTDFRTAKLESSRIRLEELKGAIISPTQAAILLERQVGVVIQPED